LQQILTNQLTSFIDALWRCGGDAREPGQDLERHPPSQAFRIAAFF
jgi:hypothetical protein